MARTPRQSGAAQSASHSPLYQAILRVPCRQCHRCHRLMITSDDRPMAELLMDGLVEKMRAAGFAPTAALTESYHPGTDLQFREWEPACTAILDGVDIDGLPF